MAVGGRRLVSLVAASAIAAGTLAVAPVTTQATVLHPWSIASFSRTARGNAGAPATGNVAVIKDGSGGVARVDYVFSACTGAAVAGSCNGSGIDMQVKVQFTADADQKYTFGYTWTGTHGSLGSSVHATSQVVNDPNLLYDQTLVAGGLPPDHPTPPANPFTYQVGDVIQMHTGDVLTITIEGGTDDPDSILSGSLEIDTRAYKVPDGDTRQTADHEFTVNTTDDIDDGNCGVLHCSLREAITASIALGDPFNPYSVLFAIPGAGPHTIALASPLPVITQPINIYGWSQSGSGCPGDGSGVPTVVIVPGDGVPSGIGIGLNFIGAGVTSRVRGLEMDGFPTAAISAGETGAASEGLWVHCSILGNASQPNGSGVRLYDVSGAVIGIDLSGSGVIEGVPDSNVLAYNTTAGIALQTTLPQTLGDRFDGNLFVGNGVSIDLGGVPNDAGDADTGPNEQANHPVLTDARGGVSSHVSGTLDVPVGAAPWAVTLYYAPSCDGAPGAGSFIGTAAVVPSGPDVPFTATLTSMPSNGFVTAVATSPLHSTSEISPCIPITAGNTSWPDAMDLGPTGGTVTGRVMSQGEARWYRVPISPDGQVQASLTGLPADYDLLLFKDLARAYATSSAATPADLAQLDADLAGSGQKVAPTGQRFSPTGQRFSDAAFSPTGQRFSPTGQRFSGDLGFAGSTWTPTGAVFTGGTWTGQPNRLTFNPGGSSGGVDPSAYSGAQGRSLLDFSVNGGTIPETLADNTWSDTGYYYLRVSGKNGIFDPAADFTLSVSVSGGACSALSTFEGDAMPAIPGSGRRTVILTDSSRIAGTAAQKSALASRLATFAARPEVAGVVVDVAGVTRFAELNAQADDPAHSGCPYAKNLVGDAYRAVVDAYRGAANPDLAYVVLVGGDAVVPFYRHADTAELAPESGYVPPVLPLSASEASLRRAYVLSQDDYGAARSITAGATTLPVADLAVGRLVETAPQASAMLDAYLLHTTAGTIATPTSSLVTGYDFMADAADAVETDLAAGMGSDPGVTHDTLVDPANTLPANGWTADQLRAAVLGSRHDIVFLAGHFSAGEALAADYTTLMTTAELAASTTSFVNSIVFSQGCHSGYNLVDGDAVPDVTEPLDWAQAFNAKGASLLAGTGYQYGDTDLVAYSEAIYAGFAHQLRMGSGPVTLGNALLAAKRTYLAATATPTGTDVKALLEATLFGLPMLAVDLPAGRIAATPDVPTISPTPVVSGPGAGLGLSIYATTIDTTQRFIHTKPLAVDGGGDVTATWWTGPDGTAAKPYQPALPLNLEAVGASGSVLRGVGFRGGAYSDLAGTVPLSGAIATEASSAHTAFGSPVFHPERVATVSYTDVLTGGVPKLILTPIQYRSDGVATLTATARRFNSLDLALFYSTASGAEALAGPPSLAGITLTDDGAGGVDVELRAASDPAAGLQSVWITYTGWASRWDPLDLVEDAGTPGRFTGHLAVPDGHTAAELRVIAQAVNAVGVVAIDTNGGAYFTVTPAGGQAALAPTTLVLDTGNPSQAAFGATITVGATLSGATPLAGQPVLLSVGGSTLAALTDEAGHASATLPVSAPAGLATIAAGFPGDAANGPSSAFGSLTVTKATTSIQLTGLTSGHPGTANGITATLTDGDGHPLAQRVVAFTVANPATPDVAQTRLVTTGYTGTASLGPITVIGGAYTVTASFAQSVAILPSGGTLALSDPGYAPAQAEMAYEVIVQAGTLDFSLAGLAPKTYGDAAFSVAASATTNATGSIVFSTGPDSTACSVDPTGTVALTGGGTCVVRATLPAAGDFSAAGPIDQSFPVARRSGNLTNTGTASWSAGTATAASVTLRGTIRTTGAFAGSPAGATGDFLLFAPGNMTGLANLHCAATSDSSGVFTCARSVPAGTWLVYLVVPGADPSWTAAPADPIVLAVGRSTARTVTGAGVVTDPSYRNVPVKAAAAPRNKGRFGVVAGYKGTAKTGSLIYTFHGSDGLDWVFTTTTWSGATLSLTATKATVKAACTVRAVKPSTLRPVAGKGGTGYTCSWTLVPGARPKLAFGVTKGTALVHRVGTPTTPVALLTGGAIRIRT